MANLKSLWVLGATLGCLLAPMALLFALRDSTPKSNPLRSPPAGGPSTRFPTGGHAAAQNVGYAPTQSPVGRLAPTQTTLQATSVPVNRESAARIFCEVLARIREARVSEGIRFDCRSSDVDALREALAACTTADAEEILFCLTDARTQADPMLGLRFGLVIANDGRFAEVVFRRIVSIQDRAAQAALWWALLDQSGVRSIMMNRTWRAEFLARLPTIEDQRVRTGIVERALVAQSPADPDVEAVAWDLYEHLPGTQVEGAIARHGSPELKRRLAGVVGTSNDSRRVLGSLDALVTSGALGDPAVFSVVESRVRAIIVDLKRTPYRPFEDRKGGSSTEEQLVDDAMLAFVIGKPEEAEDVLANLARDASYGPTLRGRAIGLLSNKKLRATTTDLFREIAFSSNENLELRKAAIPSVSTETEGWTLDLARDESVPEPVRRSAMLALTLTPRNDAHLSGPSLDLIEGLVRDPHEVDDMRYRAVLALVREGASDHLRRLAPLLDDDRTPPEVDEALRDALAPDGE